MSDSTVQNYANHRSTDARLIGAAVGMIIALVLGLAGAYMSTFLIGLGLALGMICTAVLVLRVRSYAVRLQDRIVRLEMRLRLGTVLADGLRSRIDELSLSQLIGLRYASDEELPELTQRVLDEKILKADDIKKLVTNWQADNLRV